MTFSVRSLAPLLLSTAVLAAGCGDDDAADNPDASPTPDAPTTTPDAPTTTPDAASTVPDATPGAVSCVSNITASNSYIELCAPGGTVEHVRIAGIVAPRTHASAQIFFGFDAPPAGTQDPLTADQFKVLFYGGGVPAPGPAVQPTFGAVVEDAQGDLAFVNTPSTICFDLHDSTETTAPVFVLWVDGVKGADCETATTLTRDAALSIHEEWGGTKGAIAKNKKLYFRQAASITAMPVITLFDERALR
jgi:hypothetical protein